MENFNLMAKNPFKHRQKMFLKVNVRRVATLFKHMLTAWSHIFVLIIQVCSHGNASSLEREKGVKTTTWPE